MRIVVAVSQCNKRNDCVEKVSHCRGGRILANIVRVIAGVLGESLRCLKQVYPISLRHSFRRTGKRDWSSFPSMLKQTVDDSESSTGEAMNRNYVPFVEPKPYRGIELAFGGFNLS